MTDDLRLRPPAVNLWLYASDDSSVTSAITFRWPAGSLAGRTFDALIAANGLTPNIVPAVTVLGDDVVVTVAGGDVTKLTGRRGQLELRELTTGRPEPVIVASVQTSNKGETPTSTTVTVTEGAGLVTVEIAPFPPGWAVVIDGGTPSGTGLMLIDGGPASQ